MTYMIKGLEPQDLPVLFSKDDNALASERAIRLVASDTGTYPCRVSLQDAVPGDSLILFHYTNHDVETPYRNSFAIYIREDAKEAACYVDAIPPILRQRPISLRCYDRVGNLATAAIALNDDVDVVVRALLDNPDVAYIDAHNALHGCFAARINRHEGSHHE